MANFTITHRVRVSVLPQHADSLRYALEAQEHCTIDIVDETLESDSKYLFTVEPYFGSYPDGVVVGHWAAFSKWLSRFVGDL